MTNANVVVTDLWGDNTLLNESIDLGGGSGTTVQADDSQETYVKIVNHFLSKDYEDKDILVVEYEFYNGSDEPESFVWNFSDKAFQNGIECDDMVFGCDDIDSQRSMNEIQPGTTYTVSAGYHLSDMSDVTIEVTDLFGDTKYISETISLS